MLRVFLALCSHAGELSGEEAVVHCHVNNTGFVLLHYLKVFVVARSMFSP